MDNNIDEDKIRKILIKQKKDFEKWKKDEGDSDLQFNEKDNKITSKQNLESNT